MVASCFKTESAHETQALGARLGKLLQKGSVISLTGELGAGKTTFIQGLARGMGARETVNSPSFVLINEYRSGKIPLIHLDLYRLDSVDQIEELGIADYFNQPVVVVIEWGEKMAALLPRDCQTITLEVVNEKERKICLSQDLAALLTK